MSAPNEFWKRHPGLVWSNPAADDAVHIRAALVRPRFGRLLDIALEFGLDRLRREWAELQTDEVREVARAREPVERILTHIEKGFALDYQQDFLVNGEVRVSFFAADEAQQKALAGPAQSQVRVATLPELFKTKCLVSARRSKTRDWLDLYLLMREHGFTIRDYQAAFQHAGGAAQCDIGLARLCSGVPQRDDEGYAHLLPNPPTLDEMKAFFVEQRNKLEIETAAEAARRRPDKRKPS